MRGQYRLRPAERWARRMSGGLTTARVMHDEGILGVGESAEGAELATKAGSGGEAFLPAGFDHAHEDSTYAPYPGCGLYALYRFPLEGRCTLGAFGRSLYGRSAFEHHHCVPLFHGVNQ